MTNTPEISETNLNLAKKVIDGFRNSYPKIATQELCQYININVDEQTDDDLNWNTRNTIIVTLKDDLKPADRILLRSILEQEVAYCYECGWGISNYVNQLAEMIYLIGNLEDITFLWEMKHEQFDLGIILSAEYFFGAGIKKTIAFVQELDNYPDKDELLNWLSDESERYVGKSDKKFREDLQKNYSYKSGSNS